MNNEKELIKVFDEKDIEEINWENIENYDFSETPKELRKKLLGEFLSNSFLKEFTKHFNLTKKSLSQNMYARNILNIAPMGFSQYKNSERMPEGENLDRIADHLGPVVYDICGVPRKMPKDKDFEKLVEVWEKLDEAQKVEILEFGNRLIVKK